MIEEVFLAGMAEMGEMDVFSVSWPLNRDAKQ
jgi:hypothetical protein